MSTARRPDVLVLAGRHDDQLPARIAAGQHPRVEYLTLLDRYDLELFDLSALDDSRLPAPLRRRIPVAWRLAVASVRRHRGAGTLLAMGEDVGLPLALLQGLTRRRRRPMVTMVVHGSFLASRKFDLVCRLLRRRRDVRFLGLSQAIADQLIARGLRPDQVVDAGYGVDTEFFRPSGTGERSQPPLVAAAGTANRDYRSLVAATGDLDVTVKIAADSAWFPVQTDIQGERLPVNITARSYGDYPSLRGLYDEAAVVVVPLHEARHACGYAVIVEAMAMATPVVSTRVTGRSDFITDGDTGVYVEPGDVGGLRAAIEGLVQDPDEAAAMGRRGRAAITADHSLDRYVERLAEAAGLCPPRAS